MALALAAGTTGTQDAVANGDTRSLTIFHTHTKESATITFKRDGRYDRAALEQLNWLLRDWRIDEPTKMDPRLFDTVWEAYRQVGASEPIHVVSAYRSPGTNAMLRRRSKAVAEYSQHMLGKAMDFYLPGVSIDDIRAVGLQMQRGGVGWYPHAGSPFVHLDVGSVRMWPRMSHDQLARLFPDGKTVHLASDNRPFPRYEEARAEILARGGTVLGVSSQIASADEEEGPSLVGFLAGLFGSRSDPAPAPVAVARRKPKPVVAVASADPEDGIGTRAALAYAAPAAPAADGALREAMLRRDGRDARALLTAEPPASKPEDAIDAALISNVTAPLPPRRPAEFTAVAAAALAMPLPPPRPAQFAGLGNVGMASLGSSLAAVTERPAAARPVDALVPADADAKAQLRALFAAVSTESGAAHPASRIAPVRVAQTRARTDAAPEAVVGASPDTVTTRFGRRSPGDDLTAARFTGSATRAVPGGH
ncbi:DUF882 domain-containing protein [Methylobacterium sp. E-041]|uniref:DUF882 domain-containing protein n=1 Tax=unclassified Methylobacterium TaxID=2615210 RepID=UPI001FBA2C97|nr:DUF882 domain-containing protein [Methylobacterium sp. E-041]MCJ2106545.1 DUF882 domain-containing protein [Methylobacterium sp. E-041]